MDVTTYATLTGVCGWLAGRLSDTVLDAVRVNYYVGEDAMAESAMLLGLAMENVGITPEERAELRSVLDDPDNPDLDDVPSITEAPPPSYRFTSSPPPGQVTAPDPSLADGVIAAEAPNHQGRRVHRTWRVPSNDPCRGTWLYVVQVSPGADVLRAYSGISSRLNVAARLTWPIEVVAEGSPLPSYQAAALTAADQVRGV